MIWIAGGVGGKGERGSEAGAAETWSCWEVKSSASGVSIWKKKKKQYKKKH